MRFYISFGQIHVHRIEGITYDCDSIMLIEARDAFEARKAANILTRGKWSSIYSESDIINSLHYYTRGVVNKDKPIIAENVNNEN